MNLKVLGSSSRGNCYILEGKKETLIIECGINFKQIKKELNFNLSNVVGCLVSHEHKDHSKALKDMLSNGINVYTGFNTAIAIVRECEVIETHHRLKYIKSEKQFNVGGFTVLPFETKHDCAEPLGFLIKHPEIGTMLFATDTYYLEYTFQDLNHILIECNYSDEIINANIEAGYIPLSLKNRVHKSHFSLSNVIGFLNANDLGNVRNIVLLHLSDGNSDSEKFKKEIEELTYKNVFVADKGLEVDVSIFPF